MTYMYVWYKTCIYAYKHCIKAHFEMETCDKWLPPILHSVFLHTGIEILLWCCIWSCRRRGWACPGRTGSTRPCHWRWSSLHTAGTARCTSLIERERKRSGEAGDRRLKRILEGLFSQTPQSSQHSVRPVWNSEGWNLPGWLVTAMITNTTWT